MPDWDRARVQAAVKQLRLASDPRRIRHGHGLRMGNGPGASLEFHDYRNYVMGDDLRMIDWGVYARSDQLVLRRHRQEISPRIEVILDCSASMSVLQQKWELAAGITALLLELAIHDGAQPLLWLCGERAQRCTAQHWQTELQQCSSGGHFGLRHQMSELQPGSERFLISDGLYAEGGDQLVRKLGLGSGRISLIQVLTAEEREPSAWGNVRLIDVEGGEKNLNIDEEACQAYKKRFARLQATWVQALNGRGAGVISCDAEFDLATSIRSLLQAGVVTPGAAT